MKKLAILILLLVSASLFAANIKVATFNMDRLGEGQKNYSMLSKIIQNFDLVGCIEIMTPGSMASIAKLLPSNWKYFISEEPVGSINNKEYCGYFWNNDKIQIIRPLGYYDNSYDEFIRPPYAAVFQSGKFDFTLVLDQIVFSTNDSKL